ncbi:MAG: SUF system NifU family Fe-S cluster assembly protein [Legionellales bacterium]|nr:SUF system NifU family Fe-S cluster assembly protein [Legionellales bacterium]
MKLENLYQEVILDHHKNPCNFGVIEDADRTANGRNPVCGDELQIYLKISGDVIKNIKFTSKSCAICTASASLLTENMLDKSLQEARKIFQLTHDMLTEGKNDDSLGKINVLKGVTNYPARVKCATLAWHTLIAALENSTEGVTTE